mmetsp:Transcript_3649/g.8111  ORF Transcript_3649/g.8111 Transcript_3649/m.8111 type:complete len:105 (+) Transcript_3649:2788-3102(+)
MHASRVCKNVFSNYERATPRLDCYCYYNYSEGTLIRYSTYSTDIFLFNTTTPHHITTHHITSQTKKFTLYQSATFSRMYDTYCIVPIYIFFTFTRPPPTNECFE